MLSDADLSAFGEWERKAWERQAGPYAASLGNLTQGSIAALLDAADVGKGTRLLDVGSGPGFVALEAARRGALVEAADQSAAMVEIARRSGLRAVVSGVEMLPFADAAFDAAVGGYLLNHLPRPELAVAELSRILTPGGRLAMTVWDRPESNPAIGLISTVVAALGLTGVVPPGPDAQRFSDDGELNTLLADWDDVEIQRPKWSFVVSPGAWFDAIADATPRSGAVLAQAGPAARAQARATYIDLAAQQYGIAGGLIDLPAGAVLVSARKRHR